MLTPIQSGHNLVEALYRGRQLGAEVADLQIAAQVIYERSETAIDGLATIQAVLDDPLANEQVVNARLAERNCSQAEAKLSILRDYLGEQVIHRKVVVENVSADRKHPKPITVCPKDSEKPLKRFKQPIRRHRAAGTIVGLELESSELIVKPHWWTFRGVCKDNFHVAMLDTSGKPLVRIELVPEKAKPLRSGLPLLARQLVKAAGK